MAAMYIPLYEEPAGSADMKISLFEGEAVSGSVSIGGEIWYEVDFPAVQYRMTGMMPVIGERDAISTS